MATALSSLAQRCADAGFDISDEDLGPHWGRRMAALMTQALVGEVGPGVTVAGAPVAEQARCAGSGAIEAGAARQPKRT
jgi:hypothetical protein